jgi:hypothetical protein
MHEVDVPPLCLSADVVGLARARAPHDRSAGGGVVLDVEPVEDVLPLAVDRQILHFEDVEDHEEDALIGELIGAAGRSPRPLTHLPSAASSRTTQLAERV